MVSLGLPLTYPSPPFGACSSLGQTPRTSLTRSPNARTSATKFGPTFPTTRINSSWKRRPSTAEGAKVEADRCSAIFQAQAEAAFRADGVDLDHDDGPLP